MKKHILLIILSFGIFSPVIPVSESTVPATTSTSAFNVAVAAACVVGGTLVAYGLYRWLYTPSTWTAAGIKKETEDLIKTQAKKLKLTNPTIIWEKEPIIHENLPRSQAEVNITAYFEDTTAQANQNVSWHVKKIEIIESDGSTRLQSPGQLKVTWIHCTEPIRQEQVIEEIKARATGEVTSQKY
jgi:hypothetical protein